jgi:uncharacterized FlaG/YvyC family protein
MSSGGAAAIRSQAQDASSPVGMGQASENSRALVVQQQKPAQQADRAAQQEPDKAALPITNMNSVFLRFKVDEGTSNITVYVIDRESKRVLRSIPPEEMNKLQAGDLLELFA